MMSRIASTQYTLAAYLIFAGSFGALVLASTGLWPALVPPVDSAPRCGAPLALAVDAALVLLFGVQHSVMARAGFKRAFARVLPSQVERSTFVLASAACVWAIALEWAPIGGDVWAARTAAAGFALQGLSLAGWSLMLAASFAIDHFELFGLKRPADRPIFRTPALYRIVRHPMMLGFVVGVWATPHMTVGHAVFAASMTAYVLVGVHFEERALLRELGDRYAQYRAEVPMLVPWPRGRRAGKAPSLGRLS
jgi:protein-S-isoprenylcysteine O-methyltransferase Ste14